MNGPNVRPLERWERDVVNDLADTARTPDPRQHVNGWATVPCRCGICRADRFVSKVAGLVVGFCIGYFAAHVAVAYLFAPPA